jgi:glutamine amidotransferase
VSRPIALVDYGAGNLTSVRKGLTAAGADLYTPANPLDLSRAAAIVIPGVGHFAATASLGGDWRTEILGRLRAGVPLFGICLGMQWLYDGSSEAPGISGLGLIEGTCTRIDAPSPLKVPHVGWNTLERTPRRGVLLREVDEHTHVYFTHSYAAPVTADCTASATHGGQFAAVVERDHVCGVQFHPEKSGEAGLQILRNFVRMVGN